MLRQRSRRRADGEAVNHRIQTLAVIAGAGSAWHVHRFSGTVSSARAAFISGFHLKIENPPYLALVIEDIQQRGPNGLVPPVLMA